MNKRIFRLLILSFLMPGIVSCSCSNESNNDSNSKNEETSESTSSNENTAYDPSNPFSGIVRVYYHNETNAYDNKAIYCWITGVDGEEYSWDGSDSEYGVYKDIDLSDDKFKGKVTDDFYFIIKAPGTWAGQSEDIKVTISDFMTNGVIDTLDNGRQRLNVYSCEEGTNQIETYYKRQDALGYRFSSAYIESDWKTLTINCTGNCISYNLYALDKTYADQNKGISEADLTSYLVYESKPNASNFSVDLTTLKYPNGTSLEVKPNLTYELIGRFEDHPDKERTKSVTFDKLYDTNKFEQEYTYDGDDLGVTYTKNESTFKVWSPVSIKAEVLIYKSGIPKSYGYVNDLVSETIEMTYDGNGVYKGVAQGDWANYYYTYRLYYNGWYVDVADPYATACGINGIRSGIVDFDSLNPQGWDNISYPTLNSPNELTVYEVHVRDLTSSSTWKSRKGYKNGSYNAFHESGTGYNGVTTGFDHIKELGVNAVQLLPIFDQDNDERTAAGDNGNVTKISYNWGYNPANYNCLEGSYASNAYLCDRRIKEFKSLVKDYADAGIRIIMDVVYNHVSSVSSHPFSSTCPRYYFRYNEDGSLIDDTGCSNTINSSRTMVSRYIVNSVKFWAKEYNIKGFRFDLMGCLETDTMRAVKDALYEIDPEIVVYGEGWTGGESHASSPSNTSNIYEKLGDNGKGSVGAFNDCYRDGMKGNTLYADVVPSGGFIDSISPSQDQIWNAATGAIGQNRNKNNEGKSTPASMSVNYLSCHDNYTLYDQLNYLLNGISNCAKENENAKQAALASQVNAFMSQGIGFIQGGEEIFKTKLITSDDQYFDKMKESYKKVTNGSNSWIEGDGVEIDEDTWLVRNSYKYGDNVNGFDWSRKVNNKNYFEKFKEAIKIRNESMGTYLGLDQASIDNGATICLGGSAIGGAFTSNEGTRIVITSGKKEGYVNISDTSLLGEYTVIYCSSNRLNVGSSYNVGSTTGIASSFETLILEKKK